MNLIKTALDKVEAAAEWVTDKIISKPELDKAAEASRKAIEVGATGAASYGLGVGATAVAIPLTEALATAGAPAAVYGATAAIAAAGTEVAAGGVALASGAGEVVAVGAAILFSGYVAGKVVSRAAGHAYNYFNGEKVEEKAAIEGPRPK